MHSFHLACGVSGRESTCLCQRHSIHGFDPWIGKIPWRRAWQPIPIFLPGDSHGQRSLGGCSLVGHKELDTTEATQHAGMHANNSKLSDSYYCYFLGLIEYVYFIVCSITLEEINGHKNIVRTLHRSFHLVLFSLSPYSVLLPYLNPLHCNFSENEGLYLLQPFFHLLLKILQDALQCNKFTTSNNQWIDTGSLEVSCYLP